MPTSLVKKVADKCNMGESEVEDIWEKAKAKAEDQGHEEDWGYITSIFKSMVGDDCKEAMGWNKNESKHKGGYNIMANTNKVLDRIDALLREGKDEDKIDKSKVKEALIKTAREIFDDVDEDKIDKIVDAAIEKAKDTEDAIGIGQSILRNE